MAREQKQGAAGVQGPLVDLAIALGQGVACRLAKNGIRNKMLRCSGAKDSVQHLSHDGLTCLAPACHAFSEQGCRHCRCRRLLLCPPDKSTSASACHCAGLSTGSRAPGWWVLLSTGPRAPAWWVLLSSAPRAPRAQVGHIMQPAGSATVRTTPRQAQPSSPNGTVSPPHLVQAACLICRLNVCHPTV